MTKKRVVFPENMGSTLSYEKNQSKKYDVNIDNDTLILDGSIKLNPELTSKINEPRKEQTGVTVNSNGELVQEFSDGTTQRLNLSQSLRNKVRVSTTQPITGDGTTTNPVGLNYSTNDFKVVNGELQLVQEPMELITDFGSHTYKQGIHAFYGNSATTTFGLPLDIFSEAFEQDMATEPTQNYDYHGYYIANSDQLTIWLTGATNSTWMIANEQGINSNGVVRRATTADWGKWQKLDNPKIAEETFKALQLQSNRNTTDIANLTTRFENHVGTEVIVDFITHPYKTGIHPFTTTANTVGYPKYPEAGINGNVTVEGADSNTSRNDMTGVYINSGGNEVMVLLNDNVNGGTWLYINDKHASTDPSSPADMVWHNIRGTATQTKLAELEKVTNAVKDLGVWNERTGKLQLVSKTSGNLLQQYEDGLYYGITPPADVTNLYVDAVNGVDQNPDTVQGAGTREKPLRTIAYAMKLKPANTNSNIYLHEGQEHVLKRSECNSKTMDELSLVFVSYGPNTDYINNNTSTSTYNRFRIHNPASMATIIFDHDLANQTYHFINGNFFAGNTKLEFRRCILKQRVTATVPNADVTPNVDKRGIFGYSRADGELNLIGCFIHLYKYDFGVARGRNITVFLDSVKFIEDDTELFAERYKQNKYVFLSGFENSDINLGGNFSRNLISDTAETVKITDTLPPNPPKEWDAIAIMSPTNLGKYLYNIKQSDPFKKNIKFAYDLGL